MERENAELQAAIAVLQGAALAWALVHPETVYYGPCVCHLSGDWTRVGHTWYSPIIGYIVVGHGAQRWETNSGLAQMAVTGSDFKRHSIAVATSHDVYICLPIARVVLLDSRHAAMRAVAEVAEAVSKALPPEAFITGDRRRGS